MKSRAIHTRGNVHQSRSSIARTSGTPGSTPFHFALGILCVLLLAACNNSPLDVTDADFRGVVEVVFPSSDGADVRLVDVEPTPAVRFILVRQTTQIVVRAIDGSLIQGRVSDIHPGSVLRAKTTGPMILTDPPQQYAVWVEVIPAPTE
jgi:hypothetical protein